jgi:hypothetical protein
MVYFARLIQTQEPAMDDMIELMDGLATNS